MRWILHQEPISPGATSNCGEGRQHDQKPPPARRLKPPPTKPKPSSNEDYSPAKAKTVAW